MTLWDHERACEGEAADDVTAPDEGVAEDDVTFAGAEDGQEGPVRAWRSRPVLKRLRSPWLPPALATWRTEDACPRARRIRTADNPSAHAPAVLLR